MKQETMNRIFQPVFDANMRMHIARGERRCKDIVVNEVKALITMFSEKLAKFASIEEAFKISGKHLKTIHRRIDESDKKSRKPRSKNATITGDLQPQRAENGYTLIKTAN